MRYAATLFAAITLFNCLVMIPVYASGDPTVNQYLNQTESTLNEITVLNITASQKKLMYAYVIDLMFVTFCTFFMLYKYRGKYISWKTKSDPTKKFNSEMEMAKYALKVQGIPKKFEGLTMEEFERKISWRLNLMWPKINGHP